MRTRREPRAGEAGSAAVEFALVLPLVLIVVLGLVQVGLLARDRLLVEAAARAGARAASVELDTAALDVLTERSGGRGDPVIVRVAYDDAIRVPLVGWLVGSGVTIRAEAVARQEFG